MHAENDDDKRAIAAMTRALRADPDNLEVLLSLCVSHTNELDAEEALGAFISKALHNFNLKDSPSSLS